MALPSINPDRTPLETGSICLAFHDVVTRKISDGFVELIELRKGDQEHGYELWLVRYLRDGDVRPWWVHEIDRVSVPHPESDLFRPFKGGVHEK